MKRKILFFLIIILIYSLAACGKKSDEKKSLAGSSGEILNRQISPNLTIYDLNGHEYAFSQFNGSVILVNIWASWVTSVPSEFEKLKKLFSENKEKNFKIISIALDDQYSDSFKKFYNTADFSFDIYIAAQNSELLKNFPEYKEKVPCYYLIDKKLTIRKYTKDTLNPDDILKNVKELLDEK